MGFFDTVWKNFSEGRPLSMFAGDVPTSMDDLKNKLPVNPDWLLSPIYGQPRKANVVELRNFSQSSWVQMVLNTIKREISIIPFELRNVDKDDTNTYDKEKKLVEEFFFNINSNGEGLYDMLQAVINDIGEIDAGIWVKVFSQDSYERSVVETHDALGNVSGTEERLVLKPIGKRKLKELWYGDGGTFLKQTDPYRRLKGYYQYSFKKPLAAPKYFEPDEVCYFMMNRRSYSTYGFSPLQSVQQVVELLIQSTRWNKDFFKNNAIPDGLMTLPNISKEGLDKFKEGWNKQVKGKPHKFVFHNVAGAEFKSFMTNARDLEFLDGQKWFFHLIFGAYGLSPVEAGFHENVNQGNQAGQERVTVRNALRPYLKLFERHLYKSILTDLLGVEKPPFKLEFVPEDHAQEKIGFDNDMVEIDKGSLTINEYRISRGRDIVSWGDAPKIPVSPLGTSNFSDKDSDDDVDDQRKKEEKGLFFKKAFERFLEVDTRQS